MGRRIQQRNQVKDRLNHAHVQSVIPIDNHQMNLVKTKMSAMNAHRKKAGQQRKPSLLTRIRRNKTRQRKNRKKKMMIPMWVPIVNDHVVQVRRHPEEVAGTRKIRRADVLRATHHMTMVNPTRMKTVMKKKIKAQKPER